MGLSRSKIAVANLDRYLEVVEIMQRSFPEGTDAIIGRSDPASTLPVLRHRLDSCRSRIGSRSQNPRAASRSKVWRSLRESISQASYRDTELAPVPQRFPHGASQTRYAYHMPAPHPANQRLHCQRAACSPSPHTRATRRIVRREGGVHSIWTGNRRWTVRPKMMTI
jgi:hypothetical protein